MDRLKLAEICARCERYIGTAGGGMDQAIAVNAIQGETDHIIILFTVKTPYRETMYIDTLFKTYRNITLKPLKRNNYILNRLYTTKTPS